MKEPREVNLKPLWPHIARYCDSITAIPPIPRDFLGHPSNPQQGAKPPLGAFFYTDMLVRYPILRDTCAIPPPPQENKHQNFLRYCRQKYRAIWKVSLLGRLAWSLFHFVFLEDFEIEPQEIQKPLKATNGRWVAGKERGLSWHVQTLFFPSLSVAPSIDIPCRCPNRSRFQI